MRTIQWATAAVAVGCLWAACSGSGNDVNKERTPRIVDMTLSEVSSEPAPPADGGSPEPPADKTMEAVPAPTSSLAAVVDPRDTMHVFVRTADLRCRVPDVVRATYSVEDIVRRQGGYVAHTELRTSVARTQRVDISTDTALERNWHTVHNAFVIRVPDERLDSTLLALAPLVDQLDHRVVDADNVKLQLVANALQQQRLARHTGRLSSTIDRTSGKVKDLAATEDDLLNKEARKDEALVERLALQDRVAFATVRLDLYQRETMTAALVPLAPPIEPYRPAFGTSAMRALEQGWSMVRGLVLVLVMMWPLALLGIGILFGMRRWNRRPMAA
jgi:hypothetical protein